MSRTICRIFIFSYPEAGVCAGNLLLVFAGMNCECVIKVDSGS
jgi:hypothetical protein